MTETQIEKIKKDLKEYKWILLWNKLEEGYQLISPIGACGDYAFGDTTTSSVNEVLDTFINNINSSNTIDDLNTDDFDDCKVVVSCSFDKLLTFLNGDYISINEKLYNAQDIENVLAEHKIKPITL